MNKPFIVAELSANHLGSLERALHIIDAAATAGADAVKLQTWSKDTMVLDKTYRLDSGPWKGRLLHELYQEAYTPWHWHPTLFAAVRSHGMVAFSTPFDKAAIDFLETLDCPMYKISSFEITDLALIAYVATKGKPIIISTGMASEQDIQQAIFAGRGCPVTLLKCTSAYPAPMESMNLNQMPHLGKLASFRFGLSDHSKGIAVPIAATAMGALLIEKHLTLSRADGGLDAAFSLEPDEFAAMVRGCRDAAAAMGTPALLSDHAEDSSKLIRRSLWWKSSYRAGTVINNTQIVTARPGIGMQPCEWNCIVPAKLITDVVAGTPVLRDQFE